jgi:hypothetical protein
MDKGGVRLLGYIGVYNRVRPTGPGNDFFEKKSK